MAKWSRQAFEKDLQQVVLQAESIGVEEAVGPFAAQLLESFTPEMVQAHVDSLRAKYHIEGNDAIAASRIYEAHILSKSPRHIQLLWSMFKRLLSNWVLNSSPERVVIRTPSHHDRILCPVARAAKGDLKKARAVCEALFRHDAFGEPMSTLVVKAVNPRLRWELHEFRDRPHFPCYYAIVLDSVTQSDGNT